MGNFHLDTISRIVESFMKLHICGFWCSDVDEWFEILIIGDEITLNMQILKILLKINLNDSLGGNL